MSDLPPIRREVIVDADPSLAFEVFTAQIGAWWPLGEHSVHGDESSVAFVDGVIVETNPSQPDDRWGTVTTWEPPTRLAFSWHPGRPAERASQVTVTFTAIDRPGGNQTLVRLEHSGWEIFDSPSEARAEYNQGWPHVLECYRRRMNEAAEAHTWVALLHRPASSIDGADVFGDPRFFEHVAFLGRMQHAGYLVAAGSLADEPGAGLTILRLPGADGMDEAIRLATTDDVSVVSGLFAVQVRPWNVKLSIVEL
jgi:uncharacterized protein YndB with AHSA1/START domain/uncharacterized protein YciI